MESSFEIFDDAIRRALSKYYNNPNYDDMYQECYMKILEVLSNNTYDPVYNLYGYAYTIARNTISSFLYHDSKLTTLSEDDLSQVWDLPCASEAESTANIHEASEKVISIYKPLLPEGFSSKDLFDLLEKEDPDTLVLTVVKGEFIWLISKP